MMMLKAVFFLALWLPVVLSAASPEELRQRVYAHLILGDSFSAVEEAEMACNLFSDTFVLHEARVIALSQAGKEKEAQRAWQEIKTTFPEQAYSRRLLEEMAWGILKKGTHAPSPLARSSALAGAFAAADARSVPVVLDALHDDQLIIRLAALELASHFRDEALKREVSRIVCHETNWDMRMAAIRAAGRMKITALRPWMEKQLMEERIPAEEKALLAEAIVNMVETMGEEELWELASHPRAGLRLLALQVALHCDGPLSIVTKLVEDPHHEIRSAALQVYGILSGPEGGNLDSAVLSGCLQDHHPEVALSAAWLNTIQNRSNGLETIERWLRHDKRDVRLLAAGVLSATGKVGLPLAQAQMASHNDPYVRLNLAWGSLPNVDEKEVPAELLKQSLLTLTDRWTWKSVGIFRFLMPCTTAQRLSLSSPEERNQVTRLEILNTLAMVGRPYALEAFRQFLTEKRWGLSPLAASVLLTEGDEDAIDCVKELLESSDRRLRLQAALVLASWGREEQMFSFLAEQYSRADRPTRERLIEAMGKMGGETAIPFLVERLHEPYPTLRILAASALLQCLNS